MVTGVDLVRLQIRIAEGEPLPFAQGELRQQGHAIECRVYAEDPELGFLPSPGRIRALRVPAGPGLRDDSGIYEGCEVTVHYDPLLSKLVAWGESREAAIARMRRAVGEYRVLGVRTTLPFFERLLRDPDFVAGAVDTGFVPRLLAKPAPAPAAGDAAIVAAAIAAFEERRQARPLAAPGGISAWSLAGRREAHEGRLGTRA
jgi:acetyl-CoA carboxylase biotin carboxylase subunit